MGRPTYVIGIDPGQKGGLAIHDITRGWILCSELPISIEAKDRRLVVEEFANLIRNNVGYPMDEVICFAEKIHAMPRQGVVSTCNFCRGAGTIEGVIGTLGIKYVEVTPQKWKAHVLKKSTPGKDAAIDYIMKKYPDVNLYPGRKRAPHDGIVDAMCIAEYGRYHH